MPIEILNPDNYPIPETEYDQFQESVPSTSVRAGDIRNDRVVASVKTGSKWTYLYDSEGKTIEEIKKGDLVTVTRREITTESSARQYRANLNRGIAERLANRGGALRAVQQKMNEDLDYGSVDPSLLMRFLVTHAELKLLNELAVAASRSDQGEDLVEVQREFADHLTNKLVRESRQHSLAQPTTSVQEVFWKAEQDATVEFIERVRWAL